MERRDAPRVYPTVPMGMDFVAVVQEIICGLPDATIWIGTAGRIETLNGAAEQLFGYGEEEIIGQPVSCLLAEPFYRVDFEALGRHFEEAQRLPGKKREILGRRKNGQVFPLEVGLRATRVRDHAYFCASIRDLTDTLAREDERIQAQKLEAIGRLTSGVAHDFNNLLMGIMGCAHIALARIEETAPSYRFVNEIVEAVKRGAALPAQLLAFSQKRCGEYKEIDVRQVVESMVEIFTRTLGDQIQFAQHISDTVPSAYMEVGQLEQVLMHLVLNARDAMPTGGELELKAKRKFIDPELAIQLQIGGGDYLSVEVCDTGFGIEAEDRARVFEPYFTTKNGGRGLGLSSVYGIIRGAGGHICALPRKPTGTCIRLLLPTRETFDLQQHQRRASTRTRRRTILVAEEAELVRMAIINTLELAGYEAIEASHAEIALSLGNELEHLDLLLTDLMLPGGGGVKLSQALKGKHPRLKTLLITAFSRLDAQARLAGQEKAFPVVLQKPFGDAELLSSLAHLEAQGPLRKTERVFETQTWTSNRSPSMAR